jgi:hypothetical protein
VASDEEEDAPDAKDIALGNSVRAVQILVTVMVEAQDVTTRLRAAMGVLEVAGFISPGVYDDG